MRQAIKEGFIMDVLKNYFVNDPEEIREAFKVYFDGAIMGEEVDITEAAALIDRLTQAAQTNPIEKFQLVFDRVLESLFIERMELNEDLFARYMNDPEFKELVSQWLGQQV